ncbi:MAG: hypothetical protein IT580_03605 [Verrucomicrobiales bacterium]|nr:hypothetical protein [Verrucomicrobiales bacterium]
MAALLAAGCASSRSVETHYGRVDPKALRSAMTFHASFDRGTDADHAAGDPWVYVAPKMEAWAEAKPGLTGEGPARLVTEGGRYGQALRFDKKSDGVVFYRADRNVPWQRENWGGAVSFWLRTDFAELAMGFCDPVQLTPRAWNDAAFFVEFEKRNQGVPFRLGAYADLKVWNPNNRDWGSIPAAEKPLLSVEGPPFSRDRWTHVVFTWERFNTGQADGVAALYLDGALIGRIPARNQWFTWDAAKSRLMLGVGYVGWMDDVAAFNRPLTVAEIQVIRGLPNGIRSLGGR